MLAVFVLAMTIDELIVTSLVDYMDKYVAPWKAFI